MGALISALGSSVLQFSG